MLASIFRRVHPLLSFPDSGAKAFRLKNVVIDEVTKEKVLVIYSTFGIHFGYLAALADL